MIALEITLNYCFRITSRVFSPKDPAYKTKEHLGKHIRAHENAKRQQNRGQIRMLQLIQARCLFLKRSSNVCIEIFRNGTSTASRCCHRTCRRSSESLPDDWILWRRPILCTLGICVHVTSCPVRTVCSSKAYILTSCLLHVNPVCSSCSTS